MNNNIDIIHPVPIGMYAVQFVGFNISPPRYGPLNNKTLFKVQYCETCKPHIKNINYAEIPNKVLNNMICDIFDNGQIDHAICNAGKIYFCASQPHFTPIYNAKIMHYASMIKTHQHYHGYMLSLCNAYFNYWRIYHPIFTTTKMNYNYDTILNIFIHKAKESRDKSKYAVTMLMLLLNEQQVAVFIKHVILQSIIHEVLKIDEFYAEFVKEPNSVLAVYRNVHEFCYRHKIDLSKYKSTILKNYINNRTKRNFCILIDPHNFDEFNVYFTEFETKTLECYGFVKNCNSLVNSVYGFREVPPLKQMLLLLKDNPSTILSSNLLNYVSRDTNIKSKKLTEFLVSNGSTVLYDNLVFVCSNGYMESHMLYVTVNRCVYVENPILNVKLMNAYKCGDFYYIMNNVHVVYYEYLVALVEGMQIARYKNTHLRHFFNLFELYIPSKDINETFKHDTPYTIVRTTMYDEKMILDRNIVKKIPNCKQLKDNERLTVKKFYMLIFKFLMRCLATEYICTYENEETFDGQTRKAITRLSSYDYVDVSKLIILCDTDIGNVIGEHFVGHYMICKNVMDYMIDLYN